MMILPVLEFPRVRLFIALAAMVRLPEKIRLPEREAVPAISSFASGVEVPIPTLSDEVVRYTSVPPSVQPEVAPPPVAAIVIFLLVVSVDSEIPLPEMKVRVSVLLLASKLEESTAMVLKIF